MKHYLHRIGTIILDIVENVLVLCGIILLLPALLLFAISAFGACTFLFLIFLAALGAVQREEEAKLQELKNNKTKEDL